MITPEELKNLAKKEFDISELMPEYMEFFEERAREAVAEGKTKMPLPFNPFDMNLNQTFQSLDDMRDALAKELMKKGFIVKEISVRRRGIQMQPHWYVFFMDDND